MFDIEKVEAIKYNDQCFMCLYEGHSFCSDDGRVGTCLPALCAEKKPVEDGKCSLKGHKCDKKTLLGFSQCDIGVYADDKSEPVSEVKCPRSIEIMDTDITKSAEATKASLEANEDPSPFPIVT